jgi:hypothetical protein
MPECKKCKRVTNNGLKCIICNSVYHIGCAKLIKRIKTINENQINCCEDGEVMDAASEVNDTEPLGSEDDINLLRGEIRYLKSLMEHKDVIIQQKDIIIHTQQEEIELLKDNLKLKNIIDKMQEKVVFNDSTCTTNRGDKENNEIASTNKTNKITTQLITEKISKEDNTGGNSQNKVQVPKELKDDDFILVERKRSKKPPTIPSNPIEKNKMRSKPLIGSSTATSTLSSIPKNVHLHVSRLSPDTEAEKLQAYLRPFVISISSCEKLKSKRPEVYSSFRISLPASELEKVMDPQIWPQGISINRYFFPKRNSDRLAT